MSINDISIPIRSMGVPGKLTWEARVPQSGVFQVVVFPNEKLRGFGREGPIYYDVHMKTPDGENHVISEGQLEFGKISQIRYDLSAYAGKTVTSEFRMREGLSVGSMLGRLHSLLRPFIWKPRSRNIRHDRLVRAYWSEPIIYAPRKLEEVNVFCIIVDTLRADHLGCYGYDYDTTPTIDGLAQGGVLFTQAISQSPWTLPSIASIYTGRLPTSHQAGLRKISGLAKFSPQPNLIDLMRENGYHTIAFINNPFLSDDLGMHWFFYEYFKYRGDARDGSDAACKWLESNADKKFFCVLHYLDPHVPREEIKSRWPLPKRVSGISDGAHTARKVLHDGEDISSDLNTYDSEVAFADEQIGRVVRKLDQLKLLEDTVIVFVSDHGEEFYDHDDYEHGHSLYDELLRVPLIFSFPSRFPAGKVVDAQVRLMDVLPTVLDILGMDFDKEIVAGRSLLPLISG